MSGRTLQASLALCSSAFAATLYFKNYNITVEADASASNKSSQICNDKLLLNEAIQKANELCQRIKEESGSPGLLVGVSIDGTCVWQNGIGFSDVENNLPCHSKSVMRIASISKPITMAVVAKLWQEGNLSLDQPIQNYVPEFPEKYVADEKVEITIRHLVSHLSGIRHYVKKTPENLPNNESDTKDANENKYKSSEVKKSYDTEEFLLNTHFESVSKSLSLFKDDELFNKPGQNFLYTTHGFTLVSAAIESIVKKPFTKYMKSFFRDMGLQNTYLDENKPLIYNRAKYYLRNNKGQLENAPLVDNSYKWAGGGFLSTVADLVKFGNAMLYSYQHENGFLSRETVHMIWTPVANTAATWDKDVHYGMGWVVVPPTTNYPFCKTKQFYVSHTGSAIGASSVLLIYPRGDVPDSTSVRGVVVAIIVNLQDVGLSQTALEIAKIFEQVVL